MFWLILLPFVVALWYRIYLNRGQTWGTPDERVYSTYAQKWSPRQYREFVRVFLTSKDLQVPPTRYAFFGVCRLFVAKAKDPYRTVTWVAATSGALAAPVAYGITHNLASALLVGSSPLSLILSRRALQDTFAAVTVLLSIYAIYSQNVALLVGSTWLALASREALLLYLPALFLAWGLRTGHWVVGAGALSTALAFAIGGYYTLGGRELGAIFRRLREKTDYVRRMQSGLPHRVLVDLALVSPATLIGALIACPYAPLWLAGFLGVGLGVHACVTPKNVRFLLALDLCARMLCAWLPGYGIWVVLCLGSLADFCLYRAFKETRDPITHDLVLRTGMYQTGEVP